MQERRHQLSSDEITEAILRYLQEEYGHTTDEAHVSLVVEMGLDGAARLSAQYDLPEED